MFGFADISQVGCCCSISLIALYACSGDSDRSLNLLRLEFLISVLSIGVQFGGAVFFFLFVTVVQLSAWFGLDRCLFRSIVHEEGEEVWRLGDEV